jgi:hypothetical protein
VAHGDIKRLRDCIFRTSEYRAGDEIMFQHAGLLAGRVERVTFCGRKVRYEVTAVLTFDVPESAVVGREADVLGEGEEKGGIERARGRR